MSIPAPSKYPGMYLIKVACTEDIGPFYAGWTGDAYVGLLSKYQDMNDNHMPERYCIFPKFSPPSEPMYKTFDSMDELNKHFERI